MTTPMLTLTARLTRRWVRLYTAGISPDVRDARRAEIESDLWENGADGGETELPVLGRLLLGIPADLSWRFEQRRAQKRPRGKSTSERRIRMNLVNHPMTQRSLFWLTVLLGGFYIVPSFLMLFGGGEWDSTAGRLVYGLVGVSAGAMILAGLLLSRRSPWLGGGLLTVGAVVMAVIWFWFFFVLVPLTIIVVAFGIFRARRFARERDRIAPA